MSYVISILTPPVPPDDAEAWKLWESRMDENYGGSEPSEVMRRLHDLLVARFPCITVDPNSVWTDGPLINNFGKVQAALGLVHVDEAKGFVVETANSLGLTVFDDQAGKIYRPGDKGPES